jgi:hypothetical protein
MWVKWGMYPLQWKPGTFWEEIMSSVDAFFAPDTLAGPYSEFYRRAFAELLCWQMIKDGGETGGNLSLNALDDSTFDAIGVQFGRA